MSVRAEVQALRRASAQIAQIRHDISTEHDRVISDVEDLLDGRWTGVAADQFRTAWREWCRGMKDVLEGLGLESAAIAYTRAELVGTDAERAAAARRLEDRLGEVLG